MQIQTSHHMQRHVTAHLVCTQGAKIRVCININASSALKHERTKRTSHCVRKRAPFRVHDAISSTALFLACFAFATRASTAKNDRVRTTPPSAFTFTFTLSLARVLTFRLFTSSWRRDGDGDVCGRCTALHYTVRLEDSQRVRRHQILATR